MDPDAHPHLRRFADRTRVAMLANGWDIADDGPAHGDSIFLGSFQQSVAPDFLGTVEFILESGPIVLGAEVWPPGQVHRTRRFEALVGGELGVRHLPTAQLLQILDAHCEADISLDIEEAFEADGLSLPMMTDPPSVDEAAGVLVEAVVRHALPFARAHANVDAMLRFLRDGGQTTRDDMFEAMFVPVLLAASDRRPEARAALDTYRRRNNPGTDEEREYAVFGDRLTSWLG